MVTKGGRRFGTESGVDFGPWRPSDGTFKVYDRVRLWCEYRGLPSGSSGCFGGIVKGFTIRGVLNCIGMDWWLLGCWVRGFLCGVIDSFAS